MSDDRPKTLTLSPEALFRGRVLALVAQRFAETGKASEAVRLVAGTPVQTATPGHFRSVAERTIWRWWKIYQENDGRLEALEPAPRAKIGGSLVLEDALLDYLVEQKVGDPDASIPELIRRARESGKIPLHQKVSRSTVWRALGRRGVRLGRGRKAAVRDSRRFSYEHRMQMVLADFKHFRVGPNGHKRLALYFIDDATRFVLGVLVTQKGEGVSDVLRLLHQIVAKYGRIGALFLDNGAGFKANALEQVAHNFEPHTAVILGTAGYPEGHGKIERFNRAVGARVLRHLRKSGIDPDPAALTLRLQHDVDFYNDQHHEGIGTSPRAKWKRDTRPLQPVRDDAELVKIFTVRLKNRSKVSNDHIISVGGVAYQAPRGYARSYVQVYRRVLEVTEERDALYIDHEGLMLRLHPVDAHFNARDRRAVYRTPQTSPIQPNTTSAAELAYKRVLGPITQADGGYPDKKEKA